MENEPSKRRPQVPIQRSTVIFSPPTLGAAPVDCDTVIRDFVQKSQKTCILLRNNEKLTLALKVPSQSKINFASYSLRQ